MQSLMLKQERESDIEVSSRVLGILMHHFIMIKHDSGRGRLSISSWFFSRRFYVALLAVTTLTYQSGNCIMPISCPAMLSRHVRLSLSELQLSFAHVPQDQFDLAFSFLFPNMFVSVVLLLP